MMEYKRQNGCRFSRLALRRNPGKDVVASNVFLHTKKNGVFDNKEMTEPDNVDDRKHVNRTNVANQ